MHVLDELSWRGLLGQTTDEEALRETLSSPITVYCGFDPTAQSLHVGHLLQLRVLRILQEAGHRVIALVGGSTGLIGDPKPTAERVLKSEEQTAEWVEKIRAQVSPFLETTGENPALIVNNLDWTSGISALSFLRDLGKHFRVNQMIKKDAVSARLESQDGISYTEFSYQILQANDFLHLFREYGAVLQTGGQDQWGNITAGVDLIHRAEGKSAHALSVPLMTDENGTKFGKSEGNAVWLDAELTSPYAFYQFWINTADSQVVKLLKAFTALSEDEVAQLAVEVEERPFKREGQKRLAREVTTLVHGAQACDAVIAASEALFGKGALDGLDARTLGDATAELPGGDGAPGMSIVEALVAVGLAESRNAARRLLGDGGVSVNNVKVTDAEMELSDEHFLHGQVALVKRGRKSMAALRRGSTND